MATGKTLRTGYDSPPPAGPSLLAGGARAGDVDEAGLITPEAVVLGLPLASVGTRAVALLLDLLIQGAVGVALFYAAATTALLDGSWVGISVFLLAVFGILFGYPAGFETALRGKTPGKAAMGLRVVTVEAAPVGFRHAAIRAAFALLDLYASSGGIAVVTALVTRRGQRLGDLAAGTIVIREGRRGRDVSAATFEPLPGSEGWAGRLDVTGLGEGDYLAIRSVLLRARDLGPQAEALARAALDAVTARIAPPVPNGMPAIVALTAIAAAHQQRHRGRVSEDVTAWVWGRHDGTG